MADIYEFKGKSQNEPEQEEHSCPTCDLLEEFIAYIKSAEDDEELLEILRHLVHEAVIVGQKNLLESQIEQNEEMLNILYGFPSEDYED